MTEITRVPLKPVAPGALTKLWVGVALAIAIGAGLAVAAAPINWAQGEVIETVPASETGGRTKYLTIETLREGTGPKAGAGQFVFVKYRGLLEDGTVFDEYTPITLPVEGIFPEGTPFPVVEGQTIDGFYKGLQQMQKGGEYRLHIPSQLAYGEASPPGSPIPPGADLTFEIEVMDIMTQEQFEVGMTILQQAIGAQRGGPPQGEPQGGPQSAPVPVQ
jgi:FKBP-type peptidyl-prolyl cis-trans isomerase FkpA